MPQLNPTQRPSLNTTLVQRYNSTTPLANVGFGNAQAAGSSGAPGTPGVTNLVDIPNNAQTGFKPRQPVRVTMYRPDALDYAAAIGVNTEKYNG